MLTTQRCIRIPRKSCGQVEPCALAGRPRSNAPAPARRPPGPGQGSGGLKVARGGQKVAGGGQGKRTPERRALPGGAAKAYPYSAWRKYVTKSSHAFRGVRTPAECAGMSAAAANKRHLMLHIMIVDFIQLNNTSAPRPSASACRPQRQRPPGWTTGRCRACRGSGFRFQGQDYISGLQNTPIPASRGTLRTWPQ